MPGHYHFSIFSVAASQVTHGAGTAGNESLIVRHEVELPSGRVAVPGLNGNTMRNRGLRTPLAEDMEATYGLTGNLTRDALYFFYRGGQGGSGAVVRPALRAAFRRAFPMVRLLGGQIAGGQMLKGDAIVSDGILVCRENAGRIAGHLAHAPRLFPDDVRFKSFGDYLSGWQEVGMDPALHRGDSLHPDHRSDAPYGGMPYGGESIAAGAAFVHRVTVPAEPILGGAVAFALAAWQAVGGGVGGGTARGRGRLTSQVHCQGPGGEFDPSTLVQAYIEAVEANRAEALALLAEHYPVAPMVQAGVGPGGAKGRGRKKATAVVAAGEADDAAAQD